jgi:hypothetical protein
MAYLTTLEEAKPLYTIRRYNDEIYKIVRFKRCDGFSTVVVALSDEDTTSGEKSEAALSRARRMVFEKALCNQWDYFFTGTLDGKKYDRQDLNKFHRDLTEFIKYRRSVYGTDIRFLLVPEKHKDGAWHIHGLIGGVPPAALCRFTRSFFVANNLHVNSKLLKSDYLCWIDFFKKFGFCSMDPIKSVLGVSYYITKYISKDLSSRRDEIGEHLYYCSRGLNKAVKLCDLYMPMAELDAYCVNQYEYCNTGLVTGVDWVFPLRMQDAADFVSDIPASLLKQPDDREVAAVDNFCSMKYENIAMEDF